MTVTEPLTYEEAGRLIRQVYPSGHTLNVEVHRVTKGQPGRPRLLHPFSRWYAHVQEHGDRWTTASAYGSTPHRAKTNAARKAFKA